ncbi:MAG: rhomboid family intramembrane serine protease, partial [Planctomycetaceae bacterium]
MGASYNRGLRRFVALCPITAAIILASLLLHAAVLVYELRGETEVYRRLGAVETLTLFQVGEKDGPLVPVPQMSGPFELWDGQWWRILVSAFHHGGMLHVAMNGIGIAALGWLLEPRLGSARYLLFFLAGTMISMLPEFLLEHQAVGLSGGVYALFGMLLPLRRRDPDVESILTPQFVRFGLAWLIGCVLFTQIGIVHIANAAHFTGFIYGWIAGQVCFGAFRSSTLIRWSFV